MVRSISRRPQPTTKASDDKSNVRDLFAGDEEDVALMGAYSGIISFLNASSEPKSMNDVCTESEKVLGFVVWAIAILAYLLRNFWIYREQFRKELPQPWARIVRTVGFTVLLLIINEQPLTCLVHRDGIKTVRYVQAVTWAVLAMVGTYLLVNHVKADIDEEKKGSPLVAIDDTESHGSGDSQGGADGHGDGDGDGHADGDGDGHADGDGDGLGDSHGDGAGHH